MDPVVYSAESLLQLLSPLIGTPLPIVDLRPAGVFQTYQRLAGSSNVPLEHLTERLFVLPDRTQPLAVVLPSSEHYTVVSESSEPGDEPAAAPASPCSSDTADETAAHSTTPAPKAVPLHVPPPASPPSSGGSSPIQVSLRNSYRSCATAQAFLEGWGSALVFLHDVPSLWTAAAAAGVLDPAGLSALHLRRRWLFRPSPLLEAEADRIERTLLMAGRGAGAVPGRTPAPAAACHRSTGLKGVGASVTCTGSVPCTHSGDSPAAAPASAAAELGTALGALGLGDAAPTHRVLRCLDIGCGSGRDLAWLAVRGGTALAAAAPSAAPASADPSAAPASASPPAALPEFVWHVAGLDSNMGALRRARALLQVAAIPDERVRMFHGEVEPLSGHLVSHVLADAGNDGAAGCGHSAARCRTPPLAPCASQDLQLMVTEEYDLVLCVRFLERNFLPRIAAAVAPGGIVAYSTFMDLPGTRLLGRPSGERRLLKTGELAERYFGPDQGFEVLRDDIAVAGDGRELSMFLARKTRR